MANDYVDQVAGAIIEQLRAGTAPWVKPWQPGERFMPYNPTTGNPYHGMNAVWLMSRAESRGYSDARWMTYRQAQAADAQVRKGEKAHRQSSSGNGRDWSRFVTRTASPCWTRTATRCGKWCATSGHVSWSAAVFNAEQIDGPAAGANPAGACRMGTPRAGRDDPDALRCQHPARAGDRAFYRLADDTITLPEREQFPSGDRYYATALHELGHATGHPSRLNREDLGHPFGSEAYAREELRAEIASLMLGEQLGIGHDPGQHVAYVGSWIRALENDPREIFRAAADAEKITTLVRSFEREREQQSESARASWSNPSRSNGRAWGPMPASRCACR